MATLSSKSFVVCCLGLYRCFLLDILVSLDLFPFYDLDGVFFHGFIQLDVFLWLTGWLSKVAKALS